MYECDSCDRTFRTQRACQQHMDALDHEQPGYECDTCSDSFWTQEDVDEHMEEYGHWEHYCQDCDRRFGNANNLRMVGGASAASIECCL